MKNNYLLGICIPTYNRSNYLKSLLQNILLQLEKCRIKKDIQIIIVDGNSKDNTENMVKELNISCNYKYFKREVEVGVDRDILKTVELCEAEYCWLFSDDDQPTDGAINYLLKILKTRNKLTGVFCNRLPYDCKLEKKVAEVRNWPGKVFKMINYSKVKVSVSKI